MSEYVSMKLYFCLNTHTLDSIVSLHIFIVDQGVS